MKPNCGVFITLMMVMLLMVSGTGLAAEAWTTDATTGVKIGIVFRPDGLTLVSAKWTGPAVDGKAEGKGLLTYVYKEKDGTEIKAQADAEMKAGLMDGIVSIKWSSGDSYNGDYKGGLLAGKGTYKYASGHVYEGDFKNGSSEGKGIYKWPDGAVYEGDWVNDKKEGKGIYNWSNGNVYEGNWVNDHRNGYGVQKDSSGKVIYDGEWKDDQRFTPLKVDKVLGIPWGASEEQAMSIMKQRPKTVYNSFFSFKTKDNIQGQSYGGPFAEFDDTWIYVVFFQGKMYRVMAFWYDKDDNVMTRFAAVKKGLTDRYGAPNSITGKYLDEKAWWDLGGGYNVSVWIERNAGANWIEKSQKDAGFAFRVKIVYQHQATDDLITKVRKPNAGKDY